MICCFFKKSQNVSEGRMFVVNIDGSSRASCSSLIRQYPCSTTITDYNTLHHIVHPFGIHLYTRLRYSRLVWRGPIYNRFRSKPLHRVHPHVFTRSSQTCRILVARGDSAGLWQRGAESGSDDQHSTVAVPAARGPLQDPNMPGLQQ